MKKNIIFDKNFLNENGVNVNSINATNIIVETVTQTGDLSIDGNLTISNDLDINGILLYTSSNQLYVSRNLTVSGNVTATSFNATSDRRIKDNILPIVNETIDLIKPRKYFNKLTNKQEYGFIADELQEVYENIVNGEKDGDILQSVNYIQIIPILVKEMQDLKRGLNALHLDLSMRESKNR